VTSSPESIPRRPASRAAWWIGFGGLVLTALVTLFIWRDAVARDQERMAALTEQLWQELETRVEGYEREISQLADWFGGRAPVGNAEWENRVERMKLPVNFPAFTEVLFAETVRPPKAPEMPPGAPGLNSSWAMIYRGWDFEVRQQVRRPAQAGKEGEIPELRFELPERARRLVGELGSERLNHVSGTLSVRSSRRHFVDVGPVHRQAAFTLFAGAYDQSMVNMSAIDEPAFGRWHGVRNLTRLESLRGVVAGTVAVAPLLNHLRRPGLGGGF